MKEDATELADKMADVVRNGDHDNSVILLATTMLLASLIRLAVSGSDRSLTSDEIKECMSGWDIATRIAKNLFAR